MKINVLPICYDENRCVTYVVYADGCDKCIIIDPGQAAAIIAATLEHVNCNCAAILLTHGHYDHIEGLDKLVAMTDAPVYIHYGDSSMPSDGIKNVSALFYDQPIVSSRTDFNLISDGDVIAVADFKIKVIHTPGHTPGSVTYLISENDGDILFSGDTLFRQSVGRWDFPGGDRKTLFRSLSRLTGEFADDTLVYPGHGSHTSIGAEKKHNFFLQMG